MSSKLSPFLVLSLLLIRPVVADEFPPPHDSQELLVPLLSPTEALDALKVPPGFTATLFAAEPEVQQPIAMTFDEHGRMWVAENYTYAEREVNHDLSLYDRILVLEDRDQDGRADRRTVFWDRAQRLTSVEVGFGGVWALCPPYLYFIPDQNGDLVPDAEPQVILDGWSEDATRHNFVNGLRWGPDGWLYGRHGIMDTSSVGTPGTPDLERTQVNCGIWRLHPRTHRLEVVCQGTTNPWGMDWDEHGELFFINTVIGHLWHAVPGSHFERMYGEDLTPHLYQLMEQTADHYHWDTKENWNDVQDGLTASSSAKGGGHAHSGMMIYQGASWPSEYRNELFTLNFHGRRVNRDSLVRQGATYVGKHQPDFLQSDDVWFRGIELTYGPDGAVYLLDWSDLGECHDNDGVHRSSGRIFRVQWGEAQAKPFRSLADRSHSDLVELLRHPNVWFARQARRLLQEQAAAGMETDAIEESLYALYREERDPRVRLRALWALNLTCGLSPSFLIDQLTDPDEHIRSWAVRLLMERESPTAAIQSVLLRQAQREESGLVLTYLASALQQIPERERWPLARTLASKQTFADDRVYPLMVWYGVGPAVPLDPEKAVQLAREAELPLLAEFISRRLGYELETQPQAVELLVNSLLGETGMEYRLAVLRGLETSLRGRLSAAAPDNWPAATAALANDNDPIQQSLLRGISAVFGDGRALDDLIAITRDPKESSETRRQAISALVSARAAGLSDVLQSQLNDRDIGDAAVRGLASIDDPRTSELLLQKYPSIYRPGKVATIETLASRRESARALLDAVREGTVRRNEVPAFLLRQIQLFGESDLQMTIDQLWPERRLIAEDKLKAITALRTQLSQPSVAAADLQQGRLLFTKHCGNCHKLFGEGGTLGPDLTGAQRSNLNYWFENIFDPSASVPTNYRMSLVELEDGRVITGVLGEQTDQTMTLQTPTEKIVLDRQTIAAVQATALSLMPDGLLADLTPDNIRDLFAYLMR